MCIGELPISLYIYTDTVSIVRRRSSQTTRSFLRAENLLARANNAIRSELCRCRIKVPSGFCRGKSRPLVLGNGDGSVDKIASSDSAQTLIIRIKLLSRAARFRFTVSSDRKIGVGRSCRFATRNRDDEFRLLSRVAQKQISRCTLQRQIGEALALARVAFADINHRRRRTS